MQHARTDRAADPSHARCPEKFPVSGDRHGNVGSLPCDGAGRGHSSAARLTQRTPDDFRHFLSNVLGGLSYAQPRDSMLNNAEQEKENVKAEVQKSKGQQGGSQQAYPADSTAAANATSSTASTSTYGTPR
jgi:hypothetical protein